MEEKEVQAEKTLLDWAMGLCPGSPRKRVKEWITSGRFYVDGKAVNKASQKMKDPGDSLTLGKPDSTVASWVHRKKIHPKLTVLHLDSSLAIVDKGAGLLSVPSKEHQGKSALDVLGDYLNDPKGDGTRRRLFGSSSKIRPLPVHRLDQYTSGLLCIALNPEARSVLIEQLRSHELLREYVALCDGESEQRSGSWRHYLRLDKAGYRQAVFDEPTEGASEAITHFTVEKVFKRHHVTRMRIRLETGFKHQIRIQAAEAGLSLIGDRLYHRATKKAMEQRGVTIPYGFKRQALHATVIGLKHPKDGNMMRFESQMPLDLARLESRLD